MVSAHSVVTLVTSLFRQLDTLSRELGVYKVPLKTRELGVYKVPLKTRELGVHKVPI